MVLLVTGARSGFGLRIAVTAAAAGHVVYAGLRDLDTAGDLIEAAAGHDVRPLQLDVTAPDERAAAVEHILAEQGHLDGLVNNAGIALGGFLEQVEEDELRRVLEVNLFGVFALTRLVLPTMRAQRAGRIVMISSMSGRMALPGLGAYATSKFALEGMSEAWRHELRPWGIDVTLVEPGPYKTDIFGRNRNLCRNAEDPNSPYAELVTRIQDVAERRAASTTRDPQLVADKVVDLLQRQRRPRARYPMGGDAVARSWLMGLAPFGLVDGLIARVVGEV